VEIALQQAANGVLFGVTPKLCNIVRERFWHLYGCQMHADCKGIVPLHLKRSDYVVDYYLRVNGSHCFNLLLSLCGVWCVRVSVYV
jgi:hypothetical protein